MMADPLEEGSPNVPAREEPRTGKRITCDFCKCSLSPSGDYLKMSPEAKEMRDGAETLEKIRKELADANQKIASLETKLAQVSANPTKPEGTSSPKWPGFGK